MATELLDMIVGELELEVDQEAAPTTCMQVYCLPL